MSPCGFTGVKSWPEALIAWSSISLIARIGKPEKWPPLVFVTRNRQFVKVWLEEIGAGVELIVSSESGEAVVT
jgi:hypothetical protein